MDKTIDEMQSTLANIASQLEDMADDPRIDRKNLEQVLVLLYTCYAKLLFLGVK